MGKPLQIRDVPDDVLAALKAKAERHGLPLSAYALRVLARDAELATIADVLSWPGERVNLSGQQVADLIRDERPE
jgi:plasmid stability protein